MFYLFILFLMFIPLQNRTLRLLLSIIYGFEKSDDLDGGGTCAPPFLAKI